MEAAAIQRRIDRTGHLRMSKQRWTTWFVLGRLAMFGFALLPPTAAILYEIPWLHALITIPVSGFVWLVIRNQRLRRFLREADLQIETYSRVLARKTRDWAASSEWMANEERAHDYAGDLQVEGEFSLLRFLDMTGIRLGRLRLRSMLLNQPDEVALDPEAWRKRCHGIRELETRRVVRLRFARQLPGSASAFGGALDTDLIATLREVQPRALPGFLYWLGPLIAFVSMLLFVGWLLDFHPAYHVLLWPMQFLAFLLIQRSLRKTIKPYLHASVELSGLDRIFSGVHETPWQSEYLRRLEISTPDVARALRRLASLAGAFGMRRNIIWHVVLGVFALYELPLIIALGRWWNLYGDRCQRWFQELGELDAMMALAYFSDVEHESSIATQDVAENVRLDVTDMGHPLIPARERHTNDCKIRDDSRTWIITGSNMAGKSTFLRTIGINLLLAMLMGRVCARSFAFHPHAIVTSMNATDDLSASVSLFYAEVRRIKRILDESRKASPNRLLLIDEMLRGTNARERQIAARQILEQLAGTPAVAIVATHDVLLTSLCDEDERFSCFHFREETQEGIMTFDYRLRAGPVDSSNALKILEQEGILN